MGDFLGPVFNQPPKSKKPFEDAAKPAVTSNADPALLELFAILGFAPSTSIDDLGFLKKLEDTGNKLQDTIAAYMAKHADTIHGPDDIAEATEAFFEEFGNWKRFSDATENLLEETAVQIQEGMASFEYGVKSTQSAFADFWEQRGQAINLPGTALFEDFANAAVPGTDQNVVAYTTEQSALFLQQLNTTAPGSTNPGYVEFAVQSNLLGQTIGGIVQAAQEAGHSLEDIESIITPALEGADPAKPIEALEALKDQELIPPEIYEQAKQTAQAIADSGGYIQDPALQQLAFESLAGMNLEALGPDGFGQVASTYDFGDTDPEAIAEKIQEVAGISAELAGLMGSYYTLETMQQEHLTSAGPALGGAPGV